MRLSAPEVFVALLNLMKGTLGRRGAAADREPAEAADRQPRPGVEEERAQLLNDLRERVKELTALHRVAHILQSDGQPVEDVLRQLVALLPPAFQYPQITVGRVTCGEVVQASPGFELTPWMLRTSLEISRHCGLLVEVAYLEERPAEAEGPFLAEERYLIDSLADMLRSYLDRRSAEDELRRREEEFRTLAENATDVISRFSPDLRHRFVNPAIERETGLPPQTFIGKTYRELEMPDDLVVFWEGHLKHVFETGRAETIEFSSPDGEGTLTYYESRLVPEPAPDGTIGSVLALTRNITHRKRAEEALRESEERYRQAVENSPNPIFTVDAHGAIVSWNPAGLELFQLARGTAVVTVEQLLAHPSDVPRVMALVAGVFAEQKAQSGIELVYRSSDEREHIMISRLYPVLDPSGLVERCVFANTDVTSVRRRDAILSAVAHIAEHFLRAREWEAGLGDVLARLGAAAAASRVYVFLRTSSTGMAEDAVLLEEWDAPGLTPHGGDGGTGGLVLMGEEFATWRASLDAGEAVQLHAEETTGGVRRALAARQIRSIIAVPIMVGTDCWGSLGVDDCADRWEWSAAEVEALKVAAGTIAAAVERQRAGRQIELQLTTLETLYAGARRLSESLDVRQVAQYSVQTAVQVLGAAFAWVGRADPDGSIALLAQAPGEADVLTPFGPRWDDTPEGSGPAGRAVRTGNPQIVEDLAKENGYPSERRAVLEASGYCGAASLPLVSRDRPFGVLMLYTRHPRFFSGARLQLFQAFAHLATSALENARLYEEAGRRVGQLQALRDIDLAIGGSVDLRVTLDLFLEQVTSQLHADAAAILLLGTPVPTLEYVASRGFRTRALVHSRIPLGRGAAGRAAWERRTISIPDLSAETGEFARSPQLAAEGFVSYCATPFVWKGQVKGVLEIFHRSRFTVDPEWVNFLETLAGQAAIAIDSARLFEELQRSNIDLVLAYDATIEGWSNALDLRDSETEGHTLRVTDLTLRLARDTGMSEDELVHVRRGALLHDIGKMGVPDSILLKRGPLTEEEREVMRKHPVNARTLLSPIPYLRPALPIPSSHHEKWDGTGYPRGLRGEEIPLEARIFAVVDVYDALTSDRPYRPRWTEAGAIEYIRDQSGRHFDPDVVRAFLALVSHPPAESSAPAGKPP